MHAQPIPEMHSCTRTVPWPFHPGNLLIELVQWLPTADIFGRIGDDDVADADRTKRKSSPAATQARAGSDE